MPRHVNFKNYDIVCVRNYSNVENHATRFVLLFNYDQSTRTFDSRPLSGDSPYDNCLNRPSTFASLCQVITSYKRFDNTNPYVIPNTLHVEGQLKKPLCVVNMWSAYGKRVHISQLEVPRGGYLRLSDDSIDTFHQGIDEARKRERLVNERHCEALSTNVIK